MHGHTDKQYELELKRLKEEILGMGGVVERMISDSMESLFRKDIPLAEHVIMTDAQVNESEMIIDEICIQILALRQPTASDLRFITVGLKLSKDLERLGDLAVNIAEKSLVLIKEPQLKPYLDLPKLVEKTHWMVKQVLDAFVERDAHLAELVCKMDDEVDNLSDQIFSEVLELMKKDSNAVDRGVHLILISRHLERIADHATNIGEEVIYMVKGKDIRHKQCLSTHH